jgi:hypothetical protein
MMLNLYIYGYLNRVRSSRRLEAETQRNVEVMWLMDGLTPDDKTICNFRRDNAKPLRRTYREFSLICNEMGLYGGETEAEDGSKFRANNSRKNNHNKATVERELTWIEKSISEYLSALEAGDTAERDGPRPGPQQIEAALKKLRERKEKYETLRGRLETESEVSTVDPESRLMKQGGDGRTLDVCYNVQTAVDAKHHLISAFEVTDRSDDHGNLEGLSGQAMEVMGVETINVLADRGYYDGKDIAACEAAGLTCLVAKPRAGGAVKEAGFRRERFVYDREGDCYVCPCRNELRHMRMERHGDGKEYRVYANYPACGRCPQKARCTKTKCREIVRSPYQDMLDVVDERTRTNKELYRKRQEIVEHVFGTVKAVWGYKHLLCRGKEKVTAEISLAYLAYNARRVFNIFRESGENRERLMAAMRVKTSYHPLFVQNNHSQAA